MPSKSFLPALIKFLRLFCLGLLLFIYSCNIEKHIPQDEYFLDKVKIKGEPAAQSGSINDLLQQKPNQRTLGIVRLRMWQNIIFNAKKKNQRKIEKQEQKIKELEQEAEQLRQQDEKGRKLRRKNRKLGRAEERLQALERKNIEDPVLLDSSLVEATATQMEGYLFNKGYYHAEVDYEVKTKGRKATVNYLVTPGDVFYLNKFDYFIKDTRINKIIMADTVNRTIKTGDQYDGSKLSAERDRLTLRLRENGYFNFSREYIAYEVDSTLTGNRVNVGMIISNPTNRDKHRIWRVDEVVVEPEFLLGDTTTKDSLVYEDLIFVSAALEVKPKIIADYVFFRPTEIYKASDYQSTLSRLAQLQLFKFVDIQFTADTATYIDTGILDVYIRLTPLKRQEFSIDWELNTKEQNMAQIITSSTRFMGTAGSIVYRHKNVNKSVVRLDLRPRGAIEIPVAAFGDRKYLDSPSYEYGISSSLTWPRLILFPKFWIKDSLSRLNSQTAINLNALRDFTNFFKRTTLNSNLTWQLQMNRFRPFGLKLKNTRIFLTPFDLSYVYADFRDANFEQRIRNSNDPLLTNLYDPHIITSLRAAMVIGQQPLTLVTRRYWMLRLGIENGGFVPYLINEIKNEQTDSGSLTRKVFGINYFQYFKNEYDFRYYLPLRGTNIVFRAMVGIGIPYVSSSILPFEKRFFVGGANSIRAWRLRALGPGGYDGSNDVISYDRSGDLKLESNIEYRFPVYGVIHGAFFTDVGNVWTYKEDSARPNAKFSSDAIPKQLAIGSGIGLRFDFSFFVLRLDFGLPVRDPAKLPGERMVIENIGDRGWLGRKLTLSIGVGYPF